MDERLGIPGGFDGPVAAHSSGAERSDGCLGPVMRGALCYRCLFAPFRHRAQVAAVPGAPSAPKVAAAEGAHLVRTLRLRRKRSIR